MTRNDYLEAIAIETKSRDTMRDKARVHKGMPEEAHYTFYANDADRNIAMYTERMNAEFPQAETENDGMTINTALTLLEDGICDEITATFGDTTLYIYTEYGDTDWYYVLDDGTYFPSFCRTRENLEKKIAILTNDTLTWRTLGSGR